MRFWIGGPRIFGLRTGVSFRAGQRRQGWRARAAAIDFAYVIRGDHGLVKIGRSADPEARLASLQTASPFHLDLAHVMPVAGSAFDIEQEAHAILDRYRRAGEWFACPVDVAVAAIAAAGYRCNSPSQKKRWRWPLSIEWTFAIIFNVLFLIFIAVSQSRAADLKTVGIVDFLVDWRTLAGQRVRITNCKIEGASAGILVCRAKEGHLMLLTPDMDRESLRRALNKCSDTPSDDEGCLTDVVGRVTGEAVGLDTPILDHVTLEWNVSR